MEKIITCTKCRKTFTVSGPYSSAGSATGRYVHSGGAERGKAAMDIGSRRFEEAAPQHRFKAGDAKPRVEQKRKVRSSSTPHKVYRFPG